MEQKQGEFAKEKHLMYMRKISGRSDSFGKLDRRLFNCGLTKRIYSKKQKRMLRNYMECGAHRELAIRGLKDGNL